MPPLRTATATGPGRASKACESCRKGKTRCYPSSSGRCLRCNTLQLSCSLQISSRGDAEAVARPTAAATELSTQSHDCSSMAERVQALETTVQKLTELTGLNASQYTTEDGIANAQPESESVREAPLLVIRDAVSETEVSHLDDHSDSETIIDKGFLTSEEVTELLGLFHRYYRRWITLRENDSYKYDPSHSPLLLCACCLIAVRHWTSDRSTYIAPMLLVEARRLLAQHLLRAPQPLEFFQSVLVLSLWSTTVGQKPLSVDGWLITGYGIQNRLAAPDVFGDSVGCVLLWTKLCLSHLHACISMRRKAMIDKHEIDKIKKLLPTADLSNFEMRMVAELHLYWTLYEKAIATSVNLPQAQAAMQGWKNTWTFLLDQERSQFLQMGFHFAQLLLFEQSLNNKSAAVRESLLSEMVRLCSTILQLAMDTTDDRTKHLTDHIYHMITFAAVTLTRLLCRYEVQLQSKTNLTDCDALVTRTVDWLQSLGSPLHVGHTMGDVIVAVHRKLRPERHLQQPQMATPDHSNFPDLLGMDTLDFHWDTVVPDWQSYASDEIGQSGMNAL